MRSVKSVIGCAAMASAAFLAMPAHAAVITSLPGGTTVSIPAVNIQNATGPINFGPGITFTTSSATALFGWTGAITQYQAFPWLGAPAIGLNTSETTFTLSFDNPVFAFLGQITWGKAGIPGFSNRMSAYGVNGEQLDSIDFMANGQLLQPRRSYYGFSYVTPQLKHIVFTNDYMAVRNMSVLAPAPVPEPAAWAMLVAGFALAGTSMRRRARRNMVLA